MSGPSPRLAVSGIAAAAGLVAVVTVLSRVVGLGRWLAFSHGVGATCVGQVYATANQVPNVLFEVAAGGALAAVAVPLVAARLLAGDEDRADVTASALLTWSVTLLLPLALGVLLAAEPISRWLQGDPACSSAVTDGALMLRVFAPQIALYGVGIVLAGVLQAHRRFLAAALAPLLSSLVVILTYLLYRGAVSPGEPADAGALLLLAGGTTAGVLVLSLPLLVPTLRAGVLLRPTWRFPPGTGRAAATLAAAGGLAVAAQQVCVLVTLWLTNRSADVGTITVYGYAQAVLLLPYAVLALPVATVAFPRLTDPEEGSRMLPPTLAAVLVAGAVGGLGVVALRREVGSLFLALDAGATGPGRAALDALPVALAAYAPGVLGLAAAALLSRALYARGGAFVAGGAVALGWLLAAVGPLLVLAGGGGTGSDGPAGAGTVLVVLGVASSVGLLVAAALLAVAVRRVWGRAALAGALRPMLLAAVGAGSVLAIREVLAAAGVADASDAPAGEALLAAAVVGSALVAGAAVAVRTGARGTWQVLVAGATSGRTD